MKTRRGPRRCNAAELKKVGITVVDEHRLILSCDACRDCWWPLIQSGGKLPRRYWVCQRCRANDPREG